ncbi:MAG: spore germination protein [Halanaerobiales bacterium]|nr:spore germination protein [Halanaerobiales bacterium]
MVGLAGYWGYDQYRQRQQLEVYLGNKYQQAFYEMVDHIEQLQVLLGKSLVSTSPRQNIMILTDIWSHANIAQQELTRLPLAAETVYRTAKFLSQAGDYAHVMARNNAQGRVLTEDNRKKLNELRQHAAQISASLHELESQIFSGDVNWIELVRGTKQRMSRDDRRPVPIRDGFDDIRAELEKYPTLIYDGPFSDHITETKPKGLKGSTISRERAREKAREVVDFQDKKDISITGGTSVNGKIPSYNFQVKSDNEGVYSVDISKKGGYLVDLLNNRSLKNARLDQKEAVEKARDFLAKNGYPNMEPTYSEVNENIAYISFAYKPEDIIYYPDIINVQVALDNGQILGVEALSYLMSHREREVERPKITPEEVKKLAGNTLDEIEEIRLAVIPRASLKEVLTYEIRGNIGGETYLIYINAETGDEEQILKVVKGKKGTFAL